MINLAHLGEVQEDGSILLYDKNIKYREAMTGYYRRVRQSPAQKSFLGEQGFTAVTSSFISAVMIDDIDLIIRFHNGSVYRYFGFADEMDGMLFANSKGQYFNKNIRPTQAYERTGELMFPQKIELDIPQTRATDGELFEQLEVDYLQKLLRETKSGKLKMEKRTVNGIELWKFDVNGITFYRPVSR